MSGYIPAVLDYLHRHYRRTVDICELADLVHLTPNYLRVLFKKHTGRTVLEYVHSLRIEEAKRLLLEGKRTVTEIGLMVGFRDIHYFSKTFKKSVGDSPKRYGGLRHLTTRKPGARPAHWREKYEKV